MKNKLFRIKFQPLEANFYKGNRLPVQDDLCIKSPEIGNWIIGGVNVCGPTGYQCDPILIPKLEWCIGSDVVKINSSSIESLFFLQFYAGLWLSEKFSGSGKLREDLQCFMFSNCGGGFGVESIESGTTFFDDKERLVLYITLTKDYCRLEFVPAQSSCISSISFQLHPYIFITEVMRVQKQFKQAVLKHDHELYNLVGRERFTQIVQTNSLIKTPEEHFDLTERYFANDLPKGYTASYPWYDLEELFTGYLQKNNLTQQNVEDTINQEEEKWKRENPGKVLVVGDERFDS